MAVDGLRFHFSFLVRAGRTVNVEILDLAVVERLDDSVVARESLRDWVVF